MSFEIITMTNTSDKNVVDKSISAISTITGNLKDNTSIISPVIMIEGALPVNCNYLSIPTFNRYYFVDDVRSIHNNLYEISAHVDVLKTYAAQIRACSGIIARQQTEWNLYIDDGSFTLYQNPEFLIKKFSGSGFTTEEFVLAVAGG